MREKDIEIAKQELLRPFKPYGFFSPRRISSK